VFHTVTAPAQLQLPLQLYIRKSTNQIQGHKQQSKYNREIWWKKLVSQHT